MEVKSMLSKNGKELLVINNYKFCVGKKTKNSVRWRCVDKNAKCRASASTSVTDYRVIIKCNINHNHTEPPNIQRQAFSNNLKRKAVDDLTENPAKLINMELRNNLVNEFTSKDLELVRRNIWQSRRSVLPPLPQSQYQPSSAVHPSNEVGPPVRLSTNIAMSVSGGGRSTRSHHSSCGGAPKPQNGVHPPKNRHHTRNHRATDYHTEHDTDHNNRSTSPRIGQRSQSLSALQPAAVIQPRMAQLETLEAKMASIEVSLSSATPRRKKILPITSPSPSRLLTPSATPIDQLEGLRNALRDKENIIRSLRGQGTNAPNGSINIIPNGIIGNHSTCVTPNGFRGLGLNSKDILSEPEKRHLEDKLQRIKADTENKKLTIKNLKFALDKLDITDNIDIRIQQAELEYQLGREELNLLTLLEDARAMQSRLDEATALGRNKGTRTGGTVHSAVQELGGSAKLLALDVQWCSESPRFGAKADADGLRVEWADVATGLKKGDRLVEINGKLLITRCPSRDDLTRLLSACPDPAQLVVLRGAEPSGGNGRQIPSTTNGPHAVAEVSSLRSELGIVRERAEEAQRAKDGLRADNLRLTHRISYLEEQVSELLESRRHRHHNHRSHSSNNHQPPPQNHNHNHQNHQQPQREEQPQQVRVVTTAAVSSNSNVTNINIGAGDVQVFQKGPQVTALLSGNSRSHHSQPPSRMPNSPCIAASEKYTNDEEIRSDSRRSTETEELRPSRRRADARSVKSLDLDSDYHPSPHQHYAKPRKSLDYTSEPVSNGHTTHFTRKRPTPPKKPIRLSLHRAQSLQSVENGTSTPGSATPTPSSIMGSTTRIDDITGRKRSHRGERSPSGLRWTHHGLSAVAVHLHQRQTARWC